MKSKLVPSVIGAAVLMTFISQAVFAGSGRPDTPVSREPWRIYDLRSGNIIENPDYRKLARPKQSPRWVKRWNDRSSSPERTYNPMTQQFEEPPVYRTPASRKNRVPRTSPR